MITVIDRYKIVERNIEIQIIRDRIKMYCFHAQSSQCNAFSIRIICNRQVFHSKKLL